MIRSRSREAIKRTHAHEDISTDNDNASTRLERETVYTYQGKPTFFVILTA